MIVKLKIMVKAALIEIGLLTRHLVPHRPNAYNPGYRYNFD